MKFLVAFLGAIFFLVGCEFNDDHSEEQITIEELPFEVSVTASGLEGSMELTLNGEDLLLISDLAITNDDDLSFATRFKPGQLYTVDVSKQPEFQHCDPRYSLGNESGVFENEDITVHFYCQKYFRGLNAVSAVSAGSQHTCAIVNREVKCWGSNLEGQLDVPPNLNNPTVISSGYKHSCAVTDTGIVCWGGDNIPTLKQPPQNLMNVKELKSGANFSCAIDDVGLHCWGQSNVINAEINLVAPHSLTVEHTGACVIDEGKVHCWGPVAEIIPHFEPTASSITLGPYAKSCVTKLDEVTCRKGGPADYDSSDTELLSSSIIEFGQFGACALTGDGLQCWGSDLEGWEELEHIVKSPTAISIGDYHGCAIQESELICAGRNTHGEIEIPNI